MATEELTYKKTYSMQINYQTKPGYDNSILWLKFYNLHISQEFA